MSQKNDVKKEENQVAIEEGKQEIAVSLEAPDSVGYGKIKIVAGQNDAGWD